MLTDFIRGLNASMPPHNDPVAHAALFTEDGTERHGFGEPPGGPFVGQPALRGWAATFDERWSEWTHVELRGTIEGNRAVWEGVAQATHRVSGKPGRLPIVFVVEFAANSKVGDLTVYVDRHLVAEQVK